MFTKRFTIFKLFGFEVKLDLSWLLIAILIIWSLATGFFPLSFPGLAVATYWWMGAFCALGLLFSIVFHELSHSIVARRYGLKISGITLFIFGGVAEMTEEPENAKTEFMMAIAGPLSSFLLAFIFYGLYILSVSIGAELAVLGVLLYLSYMNLMLAIFNLVPAFPLDGGRILRAALWRWKHSLHEATRISSQIGSGFGIVLIILGVLAVLRGNFIGGMWWFLIGMFLRSAAGMSYQQLLVREMLSGETVGHLMNSTIVVVPPSISVQELVEDYVYKYHFKMFPVVENSKLMGCVTTNEIKNLPREEWGWRKVRDVATSCTAENTIAPDTEVLKAMSMMTQSGKSRLMVVDHGKLVGILALKDLMKKLSTKLELNQFHNHAGK